LRPGVLVLREVEPAVFTVRAVPPQDGGRSVPLVVRWPSGCQQDGARVRCPAVPRQLELAGLARQRVKVVARLDLQAGAFTQVLREGEASLPLYPEPWRWVRLGGAHFLALDHLLLALGVALMGQGWRWVGGLTGFTVGHGLAFAWATAGLPTPRSALVELWIAASLLWLGRSLARGVELGRWGWLGLVGVGAVHGLGLAGSLEQLPPAGRLGALLWFHLGVELAQVGALALALALGWRRWGGGGRGAWTLGGVAGFLVVERAVAWWG
jgi:hypothetical protein